MDLSASYLTSGDGSSKVAAKLAAPSNDYTQFAKHAVVKGQLHIFGGNTDKRKVTSCVKTNQSSILNCRWPNLMLAHSLSFLHDSALTATIVPKHYRLNPEVKVGFCMNKRIIIIFSSDLLRLR